MERGTPRNLTQHFQCSTKVNIIEIVTKYGEKHMVKMVRKTNAQIVFSYIYSGCCR